MAKIHYQSYGSTSYGCSRAYSWQSTSEPGQVTCKSCMAFIERRGVRSRSSVPDCPVLQAVSSRRGMIVAQCPICGMALNHGAGSGHRSSHCGCTPGYILAWHGDEEGQALLAGPQHVFPAPAKNSH